MSEERESLLYRHGLLVYVREVLRSRGWVLFIFLKADRRSSRSSSHLMLRLGRASTAILTPSIAAVYFDNKCNSYQLKALTLVYCKFLWKDT